MKGSIKKILELYKKERYDQVHKKEALKALQVIESDTGYILSNKLKRTINDYATEVLGSKRYAYWLYVYTAYNKEFKEGWIPDNYFGYVIAPQVNKGIGKISNIKTLSKKIIQTDLLPDSYYIVDSTFYDSDFNIISTEKIKETLFYGENEYYFKVDDSNQGRGVFKLTSDNFSLNKLYDYGDAVIQSAIKQSVWFEQIVSGSVSTVRITTIKDKNKDIKFLASYLRVSEGNTDIVKSSQTIRVPVEGLNGTLAKYGSDASWKRYEKHPETSFIFSGQKIPYFENAVNTCIELHKRIPHFTIIGWDVSITDEGKTKIIEWNARHPDIKFSEASVGPCFKDHGWEDLHKN